MSDFNNVEVVDPFTIPGWRQWLRRMLRWRRRYPTGDARARAARFFPDVPDAEVAS